MDSRNPLASFITCILPKGEGHALLRRLWHEKGIATASVGSARGVSTATGLWGRNVDIRVEKDVLTVVVPRERTDEVFEFLYFAAGIDERFGSMLLQGAAGPAALMTLPEGPVED